MKRNHILNLVAAIFIFLFTYTAISKLLSFTQFKSTLGKLPVIGTFGPFLALFLPLSELAIAVLLFIPATKRIGAWASLIIMSLFTAYIGCAIMLDVKLPCSCGGVFQSLGWGQHLLVNMSLTLMAFLAVRMQTKILQTESNFSLQ